MAASGVAPPRPVDVVEPPRPRRLRRPADLLRTALWAALTAGIVLATVLAPGTVGGASEDVTAVAEGLPRLLFTILASFIGVLFVAVPVVVLVALAARRQFGTLLEAATAGAVAYAASSVFAAVADEILPAAAYRALTTPTQAGIATAPSVPLLAGVIAYVSVVRLRGRPRLALYAWLVGVAFCVLTIADVAATPVAVAGSAAFGRTVGVLARFTFGTTNPRPGGAAVAEAVAAVGIGLRSLRLVAEDDDVGRWYAAEALDGDPVRLLVFDRDRRALGLLPRLVRRVRVLGSAGRSDAWTVQGAVEQAVAPALVAVGGGVRTPRVLGAAAVSPDASVVAYEDAAGLRTLDDLTAEELATPVAEGMVTGAWTQLRALHRRGVSHGGIAGGAVGAEPDGTVWLLGLQHGHVAAEPLAMRIDEAALLVVSAAYLGVDRAVTVAVRAMGEERVGRMLSLVQPLVVAPDARAAVKRTPNLLQALRDRGTEVLGPAAVEEPARLERVRVRVVVGGILLGAAVYLLLGQLGNVELRSLVTDVDWRWAAVGLGASMLTYVGAALAIQAFAPVPVRFARTLVVQYAATVVALVTNPTLGPVTNVRYLTRAGASPSLAAASFGVSGVFQVLSYVVLLVLFAVLAGTPTGTDLVPGRLVVLVVGVVVLLVAVVLAVPALRRRLGALAAPIVRGTLPRLLDAVRSPRRVLQGASGALLMNLMYAAALFAAAHAYGAGISLATAGVVYLSAGVLANAAPTPGGIGAVEAAVAAALAAVGVAGPVAVQAALLFRAVTFWIPVGMGWLGMAWLQRRDAL